MAPHSSTRAWKIPWTEGCRLWGRTESDTTEVTQQQQQQGRSNERIGQIQFGLFSRRKAGFQQKKKSQKFRLKDEHELFSCSEKMCLDEAEDQAKVGKDVDSKDSGKLTVIGV